MLNAPDQMRQRMAWALSQIYVNGAKVPSPREIEPHAQYYDIMVKNAFGSLRDVIREVAFSPTMSRYVAGRQCQFPCSVGRGRRAQLNDTSLTAARYLTFKGNLKYGKRTGINTRVFTAF